MAAPSFSKFGFVKSYVLPVLITFLIPVLGLLFYSYAERNYDSRARESILRDIETDSDLSAEEKRETKENLSKVRLSRILASSDPALVPLQKGVSSEAWRDYAIFRWMRRTAALCILIGILAAVAVGIAVAVSFRSQRVQYWSLRVGWHILRLTGLFQVVGQGVLIATMSYWVSALLAEMISIKLIAICAIGAVVAVGVLIAAIFKPLPGPSLLEGQPVSPAEAPELWSRVGEMARTLGIPGPDHIVVGIDDNFFVTEHPHRNGQNLLQGRTLFASLALLKVLSRAEADAVLGHELAHFSGEDTLYGRKTAPLLQKYMHYLEALYKGGVSRPVFYFMFFFWNLFQLSLGKVSREREFRADRVAAQLTSPQHMAGALVKIAAYCKYRVKVQQDLLGTERMLETVDIARRLDTGFPDYLRSCVAGTELGEARTPHPFDSHPPLDRRLASLGLDPAMALRDDTVLRQVEDSWFTAIRTAAELEAKQWKEYEDKFHKFHETVLTWRFLPEGDEQVALVQKHFPPRRYNGPKGQTLDLDYCQIRISTWEAAIRFSTITKCVAQESGGKKHLTITYLAPGDAKSKSVKFLPAEFAGPGDCLQAFSEYYGRSVAARAYHAEKAKERTAAQTT